MKKFWMLTIYLIISMFFVGCSKDNGGDELVREDLKVEAQEGDMERKIVGYFPEWAYKSEQQGYFNATHLQWEELTHIQYSFAMVDSKSNKIMLGDENAAIKEDFKDYKLEYKGKEVKLDNSLPYKGHFNVMQVMKEKYPQVKLLISVGGWAGSGGFYTMMDTDEGINTFADSCVEFIREYGFDGVDIDFEYPSSTSQSGNPDDFHLSESRRGTVNERYNLMMKTLRVKLDEASKNDKKDYILSAAVTASPWVLGGIDDHSYVDYLDFLSIMSYDYHGGWNNFVEHLAGIYPNKEDRETISQLMPTLCFEWAYNYYRGVLPSDKILMGIPYYTRGWENVQGGTNGLHGSSSTAATGKYNIWGDPDANGDIIPAGANPLWHVLNLVENNPNMKIYFDEVSQVPYVWENNEKVFLSFENEKSIDARLKYIEEKNLGGTLIWVMNGDYGTNPNYKKGSDKINEGKYTFGNTLTKRLRDGLNKMGPCKEVGEEGLDDLEEVNASVEFTGNYDHPNYNFIIKVTNHSKERFDGGYRVSFDLPKSAVFKSCWGATYKVVENGDFNRVTLMTAGYQNLEPGETIEIQGAIGLCFSSVKNITFNGMKPVGNKEISGTGGKVEENNSSEENTKPSVDTSSANAYSKEEIYTQGDKVSHNGAVYRCKWWTQGDEPGKDEYGPWEKVQ